MMKTCSRCGEEKSEHDFYFAGGKSSLRRFSYCKTCHKSASRRWGSENLDRRREIGRKHEQSRRLRLRQEIFDAYGHECSCCGETMEVVLDVDHVNNDGAEHRKEVRSNFYAWLKQQGFPEGYQILCRNCNWAKFRLGECPHALVLESR